MRMNGIKNLFIFKSEISFGIFCISIFFFFFGGNIREIVKGRGKTKSSEIYKYIETERTSKRDVILLYMYVIFCMYMYVYKFIYVK